MDKISTLLDALDAYCKAHGKSPQSVVRAATGNPRLYDRLKNRRDRVDEDFRRIANHIGLNLSVQSETDMGAERHGFKGHDEKGAAA